MLSRERLDRIHVAFDDHRLVSNAGLILPITLAHHLGWVSWWTTTLTWETRRVGPMLGTSC